MNETLSEALDGDLTRVGVFHLSNPAVTAGCLGALVILTEKDGSRVNTGYF